MESSAAQLAARLDRLPMARHIWYLVTLISLGGCFELYDLFLVKVKLIGQDFELLGSSLGRRFLWSGSALLSHAGSDGAVIQGTVCRLCMDQTVEAHGKG